ncbi:hypothetical protein [Pseudophaeobacter sp.]|uniref:hypothetical protein n=1 Tax=Pseudophaeobacter sp. TaxID=1971739 RepID=UPI0032982ABD
MLAYFFTALGIGLAVGLVAGLVIGLVGLLTFNLMPLFFVAVFAILVGATWAFYRLSPLLPAAALGERLGVKAAWAATAQISGAVLVAALILAISAIGIGLVIVFGLFPISIALGMAMIAVLQWAYSMVGISVLTTVYGISVQERSI